MKKSTYYLGLSAMVFALVRCGRHDSKKSADQGELSSKISEMSDISASDGAVSVLFQSSAAPIALLRACTAEEKTHIFTSTGPLVMPACSLTFDNSSQILKRSVKFLGSTVSGSILDCNGGSIQPPVTSGETISVQSKLEGSTWSVPKNIIIKNCAIMGSTRVYGLGVNGEAPLVRESSRREGHTERAQEAAPSGIHIVGNQITANVASPIYLGPGVTDTTIESNNIKGESNSVSIYLDAESAGNKIVKNRFGVQSKSREVIAVDGSRLNTISGNYMSGLTFGGIFIYRNCGEGGTVRHQQPTHNAIINNFFYYDKATNANARPAVHLASRNGNRRYCGDDNGFPWGSSQSNLDFANRNLVVDNQIRKLSASSVIINSGVMNAIGRNATVSERQSTRSGCPKFNGFENTIGFLGEGQTAEILNRSFQCQNGELVPK
jgi:hypothetical protein